MQTQVRFILKPEGKNYTLTYSEQITLQRLLVWITTEKKRLQNELHIDNLKAFVRKDLQNQAQHQYIKIANRQFLESYLVCNNEVITVQFFYKTRKESITSQLNKIGLDLQTREMELKAMVNELKDETSQFYVIQIISKTSRSYSAEVQHIIDIFLVVSDPLASIRNDQTHPIYNDQVNITSHIERLKRASMSDCNLTIRARREWATRKKLVSILSQEDTNKKKITIVQLLTEVRRINNKLMLSLEGPLGEQMWQSAEEVLSYYEIDLLIIIGVGANLLHEINYPKPLILITSISIQQKRIITQSRNMMDSQNIYNDAFSQVFLQNFYQNLFKRMQIGESVQLAKRQVRKLVQNYIWCCCMHQHAPNCGWEEIINKIGYMEAHRLFKHNEYKVNNYYQTTFDIQQFLLNKRETCCNGNICCYEKLGYTKLVLHQQINKILLWNQKCSQVLYSNFENSQKRLNKFQTEQYDKPSGRKRPLTIYKLLQAIVKRNEKVLIIRSPTLSLAKRYLSFAKEYLQTRDNGAYFCQYTINKEQGIKKYLKDILKMLKSKTKLGTNTTLKISLYIQISYNAQKHDKYYTKLFNEEPNELLSQAKALGLDIERAKIILLTCNPNFDDKYPIFKIDDPQKSQLYHYHLSKYSYKFIRENLEYIKSQIDKKQKVKDQIGEICDNMLFENELDYLFLGFISLFSEDGFYLTKYGRIVLQNLFGEDVVNKAINHTLPIEIINLTDCIYIQLHKSYQEYFLIGTNNYRIEFQKKQLEYYYILFRTYCELMIVSEFDNCEGVIRLMFKNQGLFSINIMLESDAYDEIVEKCKEIIKQVQNQSNLFDYNNFRHFYHINQTEKIIQNFMKRKKNQYVATSKSIIRQFQPFNLTYLFWNIIHMAWKILLTMSNNYIDKVNHFQTVLLIFLIRMQIITPFAEIARLQLYMMIGRIPPKSQELFKYSKQPSIKMEVGSSLVGSQIQGSMIRSKNDSSILRQVEQSSIVRNQMYGSFKCSKQMCKLLNFLRIYSAQQYNLSQVQISWGQLLKFQDEISPCIKIAEKIIELLQNPQNQFKEELQEHRMFKRFNILQWNRQILKFTQRKIVYYFQLTKMLKHMQAKQVRTTREKEFHKQFKLIDLVHQFRSQRQKLPQNQRNLKHRILIDHYLKILMNQSEVHPAIIEQIKGKLSAQYLSLFDHLCQKIEQNTLFNQKGLIICARSRTIRSQGRPYIMSRKRNLTMLYLKENIQKMKLKISYFTLNTNTLNILKSDEHNKRCQMLFLILTVDCPSSKQINFGEDYGINSQTMQMKKFAEQIKCCRINILVVCGKNSIKMCQQLVTLIRDWDYFPNIIALQSNKYNICDEPFHNYTSQNGDKAWQFLCNEVNQIANDMLTISIIANINNKLSYRSHILNEEELEEKVTKGLKMVHTVLEEHFQCTSQVLNQISFKVWSNNRPVEKILPGALQDLTAKFYSSQHNLHDENYYENVGRCAEVNQVVEGIVKEGQKCIEILGNINTGKSTLLQEICWISQTKNIFKFGVFLFKLNEDKDTNMVNFQDFFRNRQFKSNQNFKTNQTSVLIALDNVDDQFLNTQKHILKSLRGKSVTIVYTTVKKEFGENLQAILQYKSCLSINLNKITLNEVYGFVMSYIKLQNSSEDHKFSKKMVRLFEKKVEYIMKVIEKVDDSNKLSKAIELLKEINPKKEDEKINLFLHFYKKNFDGLHKLLQNIKELKVKIE